MNSTTKKIVLCVLLFLTLGYLLYVLSTQNKERPTAPSFKQDTQSMRESTQTNSRQLQTDVNYTFSEHCKEGVRTITTSTTVCISSEEYEKLCNDAQGVTKWGAGLMASFDTAGRYLVENGEIENVSVEWMGAAVCRAFITVSGIYNGSSTRRNLKGRVDSFIISKSGSLLANDIFDF